MKTVQFGKVIFGILLVFISPPAFAQFQTGEAITSAFDSSSTISLDLKGMDVVEVLKTLASKGNMNVVVGANVRGRVTMFLKDVDVRVAFEIILLANNLAADQRGDIVYVMTQRDYEQLYGETFGDKKIVRIIKLKYAKITEVSKALNQIKTKIGKIVTDEATSTIVIIDAPQAAEKAVEAVKRLNAEIGIPLSLRELGVKEDELRSLAEATAQVTRLIGMNPRPLDADSLEGIIREAF